MSTATRLSPTQNADRSEALPQDDLDRFRDAEWAIHDPSVQRGFHGHWVVAFERKIIAHGSEPNAVLSEALRVASGQNHRLVFCAVDTGEWLDQPTDLSSDFAHA